MECSAPHSCSSARREALLAPDELRRALLGEGREAFLRVLAREQRSELVRLGLEAAGVVDAEREIAQPLRERKRERALRRELARRFERAVEHRVGDRVDEPDPQRLLRADGTAGEDELFRDADAAHASEPLRPAPAGNDAEVDLRLPELGATRRVPNVARERELAAAAERKAVDRGDR